MLDSSLLYLQCTEQSLHGRQVADDTGMCRALGAGALALGSKAAVVMKSGGGLSGLAKGAGMLAVGGELCTANSSESPCMVPVLKQQLRPHAQAELQRLWARGPGSSRQGSHVQSLRRIEPVHDNHTAFTGVAGTVVAAARLELVFSAAIKRPHMHEHSRACDCAGPCQVGIGESSGHALPSTTLPCMQMTLLPYQDWLDLSSTSSTLTLPTALARSAASASCAAHA